MLKKNNFIVVNKMNLSSNLSNMLIINELIFEKVRHYYRSLSMIVFILDDQPLFICD